MILKDYLNTVSKILFAYLKTRQFSMNYLSQRNHGEKKALTGKNLYWDDVTEVFLKRQKLWRIHNDAVNVELLEKWLPDGQVKHLLKTDLFDEAVSEGLYPLLASRAKSVFGIDLSVTTIQAARSCHSNLQAIRADVRHLPFADDTFDIIVSNSTLDHFESPDEILKSLHELHRLLRSGGQLLITLDNLINPVIALRSVLPFHLLKCLGIVPYYVGATFGPHRLQNTLKQLNFEVIEVDTLWHFPRIIAVIILNILEKHAKVGTQKRFLRFLFAFERLSKWPTRFITGYYVAARAIKK